MKDPETIKKIKARTICYNIFSALLCQPSEDLFEAATVFKKLNNALKIAAPGCELDLKALKEDLAKNKHTSLLVEYTRLFIGPVRILVPPYGGLYFGGEHLMNDEALRVADFYKRTGLQFNEQIKDSPDHVVIETEFLYYLSFKELKELEAGNLKKADFYKNAQREFLENHYAKWIPRFCDKVQKTSKIKYFKLIASALSCFVSKQIVVKQKTKKRNHVNKLNLALDLRSA